MIIVNELMAERDCALAKERLPLAAAPVASNGAKERYGSNMDLSKLTRLICELVLTPHVVEDLIAGLAHRDLLRPNVLAQFSIALGLSSSR